MPENFGYKAKLMHKLSELSPVDNALKKRAEWFVKETGIESHLKENGKYIDMGTGKGHITEKILHDMAEQDRPLCGYYGIDIADKPLNKVQKQERKRIKRLGLSILNEKNPTNFSWASAEALPFKTGSVDGVSFVFSIHHMEKKHIDESINEAKRVIKKGGLIFIAEDIVETENEKKITEAVDRKLNWEAKAKKHNYKSDGDWEEYLKENGLKIIEKKLFQSGEGDKLVKHAFYVIKKIEE